MLYIFVNKERNKVHYVTRDKDSAKQFYRNKKAEFVARYFDNIEIYEVNDEI